MPQSSTPPPFEAYKGKSPFVFVSYAHKDCAEVFPVIDRLNSTGVRIWFDEGIDPGNEWPDEVAQALDRSAYFVVFISSNAVASRNVKNEIHFALNAEKPFLAIHLQETDLPLGLKLRMGDIQAILKYHMDDDRFYLKLTGTIPPTLAGRLTNNKVFACYADADRGEVVRRLQTLDALMIETFFDLTDLKSGEDWDTVIREAVEKSKLMLLFWSEAARKSPHVEKEWRCALKMRGLDYIRPIPLCPPEVAPPPPELATLHFNSFWLRYIKSGGSQ